MPRPFVPPDGGNHGSVVEDWRGVCHYANPHLPLRQLLKLCAQIAVPITAWQRCVGIYQSLRARNESFIFGVNANECRRKPDAFGNQQHSREHGKGFGWSGRRKGCC